MANAVRKVFVDTNILVYANSTRSPLYNIARDRIKNLGKQGVELWISTQVVREYLNVMSKPTKGAKPVSMAALIGDVEYFSSFFNLADENADGVEELLNILEKVTVRGIQIYDANLIATMHVYGIKEILTHNVADFTRYNAFITVLPLV